jgi:very-short-patch-repair endonuclease
MQDGSSISGSRRVDDPIAELARGQHGVVGRRQLGALGFDKSGIDTRVRRGHLLVIHRGVYAVGHRELTQDGRWMAATLAGGESAVLSHRSAGQLWGLVPRTGSIPEVTRPTAFRARPGIRAHQSTLPADEVEQVDGIPVTSVSRTLLDLAPVLGERALEKALNEAEVRRLTSIRSLPDLLERYPRRRGASRLRAILREHGEALGVTRNDFEEGFLALVDRYDLPRPRLNADLAVAGRFFEVDCLWRERRLIVELDGRAVHGTRRAFEADRERDRLLVGAGWRVIRITWRQLRDDAPAIAGLLGDLLGPTLRR